VCLSDGVEQAKHLSNGWPLQDPRAGDAAAQSSIEQAKHIGNTLGLTSSASMGGLCATGWLLRAALNGIEQAKHVGNTAGVTSMGSAVRL